MVFVLRRGTSAPAAGLGAQTSQADHLAEQRAAKKQRDLKKCSTSPVPALPGFVSPWPGWDDSKARDKLLAWCPGFLISGQDSPCLSLDLGFHVCVLCVLRIFFLPSVGKMARKSCPAFLGWTEGRRETRPRTKSCSIFQQRQVPTPLAHSPLLQGFIPTHPEQSTREGRRVWVWG